MINNHNVCLFEGKMTKNATYSQFQGANGPVDKVFFSVMVPRALTSQQRQAIKNGDKSIKGNDFVQFSMIGPQVATLKQYFTEGTPVSILARFTEYQKTDSAGNKSYGYVFEVENISFVVSASPNQQSDNGTSDNNAYGYQQAPQQNFNNGGYQQAPQQQQQQMQPQQQQQNQNFQMFPSNEFPF